MRGKDVNAQKRNSMNDGALIVRALSKRCGRKWALQDCSFDVPAGRICALVGPNGAGKSTLRCEPARQLVVTKRDA